MAMNYLVPVCYVTFDKSRMSNNIDELSYVCKITKENATQVFKMVELYGYALIEKKSKEYPYGKYLVKNYNGTEYKVLGVEMTKYKD